jgi:hypothetical protein
VAEGVIDALALVALAGLEPDAAGAPEVTAGISEMVTPAALQRSRLTCVISVATMLA